MLLHRFFHAFLGDAEGVDFIEPDPCACIAWHAEVAPRGEGDGADLRSVGKAGSLELLGEKSAVEIFQPFQNGGVGVFSCKGLIGNPVYLGWAEFRPEHIV